MPRSGIGSLRFGDLKVAVPKRIGGGASARVGRTLWMVLCFVSVFGLGEAWADTLSAADVIRLARTQDPEAIAARQAVAVAEGQQVEAGLFPNPSVGWDREYFPDRGSGSEQEDALFLTVPLDFSSRSTRKHLAQVSISMAGAQAARTQSHVIARALTMFYRLIAERQRVEIEARAAERLAEATRVVTRRKEEGSASGYDQTRIEIEAELVVSALRQTRARAEQLRRTLAQRLGVEKGSVDFSGRLDPDEALVAPATQVSRTVSSPSLRLFRAAEVEAIEARDSAGWSWIPPFSISGGLRRGVAEETRYGYVAGVSVDLPLFSRGQGLRAQAAAHQSLAQARVDAAERMVQIDRDRAEQTLRAVREDARQFDAATRDRMVRLERAAQSGYREGRLSIVQLLDARRAGIHVETRRLELLLSIKETEVALRAARGEFE